MWVASVRRGYMYIISFVTLHWRWFHYTRGSHNTHMHHALHLLQEITYLCSPIHCQVISPSDIKPVTGPDHLDNDTPFPPATPDAVDDDGKADPGMKVEPTPCVPGNQEVREQYHLNGEGEELTKRWVVYLLWALS